MKMAILDDNSRLVFAESGRWPRRDASHFRRGYWDKLWFPCLGGMTASLQSLGRKRPSTLHMRPMKRRSFDGAARRRAMIRMRMVPIVVVVTGAASTHTAR